MVRQRVADSYSPGPRGIHWTAAFCVLLDWTLGIFGDDLPKPAEATGLFAHISLGLAVL